MRLTRIPGDVLTSRYFWYSRAAMTAGTCALIIGGMRMDYVLYTPAEYLPALIIVGLAITGFFVTLRGIVAKQEHDKKLLRNGQADKVEEYGLDYMASHVGTIAIGILGAVIFPGLVYEAVSAPCDYAGALVIALAWSFIVGVKGADTMSEVVDLFRNNAKIQEMKKQ